MAAWTGSRPGGWPTGWPRCIRSTGTRPGTKVRAGAEDRLVVLFSHHGLDTLTNTWVAHLGPGGEPLLPAADFMALLHRFPNVVLWLNGHTHINAIRARRDPAGLGRGFWEVTTCAVVDWPCQTRIVELADSAGQLVITCTMVDHHTPLARAAPACWPGSAGTTWPRCIVSWPSTSAFDGPHPGRSGSVTDRNVQLLITPPFPLSRLPAL